MMFTGEYPGGEKQTVAIRARNKISIFSPLPLTCIDKLLEIRSGRDSPLTIKIPSYRIRLMCGLDVRHTSLSLDVLLGLSAKASCDLSPRIIGHERESGPSQSGWESKVNIISPSMLRIFDRWTPVRAFCNIP